MRLDHKIKAMLLAQELKQKPVYKDSWEMFEHKIADWTYQDKVDYLHRLRDWTNSLTTEEINGVFKGTYIKRKRYISIIINSLKQHKHEQRKKIKNNK